jgi:hypothetical protein
MIEEIILTTQEVIITEECDAIKFHRYITKQLKNKKNRDVSKYALIEESMEL